MEQHPADPTWQAIRPFLGAVVTLFLAWIIVRDLRTGTTFVDTGLRTVARTKADDPIRYGFSIILKMAAMILFGVETLHFIGFIATAPALLAAQLAAVLAGFRGKWLASKTEVACFQWCAERAQLKAEYCNHTWHISSSSVGGPAPLVGGVAICRSHQTNKDDTMLKTYTAVLLATVLVAGPAFAQSESGKANHGQGYAAPNSQSSNGGGNSGYNEALRKGQW
jgi:hypothetical protein